MNVDNRNIKKLSDQSLVAELKNLVQMERKITAEVIECIKEIDQRRLYLGFGYTSMFAFLTKEVGYTPAATQRRIDAARLSQVVPELKENLKSGLINLSQVSMLAQAVRQKQKEDPQVKVSVEQKQELFQQVQSLDLIQTEKLLAKGLDIQVKKHEAKSFQQDGSVRIELTLSAEQLGEVERVKELISHQQVNPSVADIFNLLLKDYLGRKDPLRRKVTSAPVALVCQRGGSVRKAISAQVKTMVFQRDRCCQWTDPLTKRLCGSKFQLQIDHREPRWQDGGDELENLQLLCAVHNRLKYQREVCGESVSF